MITYPKWIDKEAKSLRNECYKDFKSGIAFKKYLLNFVQRTTDFNSFPKNFLKSPAFKDFLSCHLITHDKGTIAAKSYNFSYQAGLYEKEFSVSIFNRVFNSIKKSKNKHFNSEKDNFFSEIGLIGTFLAKEISLKEQNYLVIVSRNDFLAPQKREINNFALIADLLPTFIHHLKKREFITTSIIFLKEALAQYPKHLTVKNAYNETLFTNHLLTKNDTGNKLTFTLPNHRILEILSTDHQKEITPGIFHRQRIEMLGDLLNTLRHEINNPLFGLKLAAGVFNTSNLGPEKTEIMTDVSNNIEKCLQIIESFSSLFRLSDHHTSCSGYKIIKEAVTLAKSTLRAIELKLPREYEAFTCSLNNQTWATQIVFNLLINSAQALHKSSKKQKKIQIKTFTLQTKGFISIEDNADGIPRDSIQSIFKPFFTTKDSGTGLGLAISKNLAEKLGGDLVLEKSDSQGTCFTLELPLT